MQRQRPDPIGLLIKRKRSACPGSFLCVSLASSEDRLNAESSSVILQQHLHAVVKAAKRCNRRHAVRKLCFAPIHGQLARR
jgi:hypothetical protein